MARKAATPTVRRSAFTPDPERNTRAGSSRVLIPRKSWPEVTGIRTRTEPDHEDRQIGPDAPDWIACAARRPVPAPDPTMKYDALVLGAGPAGYVCAIRCAQLGLKTAVVEREYMGGVCLNVGCIPSKALINAGKTFKKIREADLMGIQVPGEPTIDVGTLVKWKEGIVGKLTGGVAGLLKNHKIDTFEGSAQVTGPHSVEVGGKKIEAKNIVVAVGSTPIEIPGFPFSDEVVWSSTEALAPKKIPERMLIIGGGYIGLELGLVYHNLGTEIRVVEFMDRVLPGMEGELSKEMGRFLKKKKIPVHLGAKAKSFSKSGKDVKVEVEIGGKTETFACDVILSTVGRRSNAQEDGLGLAKVGVAFDGPFVQVDGAAPVVRAEHLRDRRLRGPAHARAQGRARKA